MSAPRTEALRHDACGFDQLPDLDAAALLLSGQHEAMDSLASCLPALTRAARLMSATVEAGGRLIYAAAGSSGLMALADAAELAGTYGLPSAQIAIYMAGGIPVGAQMPGDTEDDAAAALRDAEECAIGTGDLLIALTASGSTPYPVAFARIAKERGAHTICLSNNAGTPILDHADIAVLIPTPAEMIAGSTRMGAATAQKVALNIMSTLMGTRLGHIHDGMMVNMVADNGKLRERAIRIVEKITGSTETVARESLAQTKGALKPAILIAAGAGSVAEAENLLLETKGHLRAALARI